MLSRLIIVLYFALGASFVVAQSSASILCVAGQCLQGFTSITLGATLSAQGAPSVQLLPGQYTSTTNPQLLHDLLTSSSAILTPSPGFSSSSVSPLPLNIALQPGFAIYSNSSYAGQVVFSQLDSARIVNSSIPLLASSMSLSNNVWAAVTSGSTNNSIILWDAIPDFSQLPLETPHSLFLVDIQSSACSPPCSGSAVCSSSGKCSCPKGFTGSSCEVCAQGFFGPTCQPCPSGCQHCDQGISGSGVCFDIMLQCNNSSACDFPRQCPMGSYFSPTQNTCARCVSSCSVCLETANYCLGCTSNQFAFYGQCVPTCPIGTYSVSGTCLKCHPDCASCSGSSFSQCTTCPPNRPVLSSGRCLRTCNKPQFIDPTTGSCQACDPSCSSCSGSGPSLCLACSSPSQVLRAGSCVSANCDGSPDVVPGLGVCLSDLVQVPTSSTPINSTIVPVPTSTTSSSSPSATGSTVVMNVHRSFTWWEILLMALGCVFICIVILMIWRRRAMRRRANRTAMFASAKMLDGGNGWRWGLAQLRRRLFGRKPSYHTEAIPVAYHDDRRRRDSLAISLHSRIPVSPNQDIKPKELRYVEDKSMKKPTADRLDNFIAPPQPIFIQSTTPITLTPSPPLGGQTRGQGPYWLSPIVNTHPIGGSQQQFHLLDNNQLSMSGR